MRFLHHEQEARPQRVLGQNPGTCVPRDTKPAPSPTLLGPSTTAGPGQG